MTTTTSTHLCGSWCRHDLSPLFALYGACTCPPTWNATIPPPCAIHNPTPPGWEVVTTTYNLTAESPEPEPPPDDADDYPEDEDFVDGVLFCGRCGKAMDVDEDLVEPPDTSLWAHLPETSRHPYTCGVCPWGRDGAYYGEADYIAHMSEHRSRRSSL